MRLIDADALIKELNNEDNQRILDGLACCNSGDMEEGFVYGLGAVEKLINDQSTIEQYTDCKQKMPPEKRKEEWGTDESDVVRVVIENTGGGVTTYECGYDYTINGKWNDGDGTSGRTTIAWKFD